MRLRFADDREDLDCRFGNVIEHPDFRDSQPILRPTQPTHAPDSALAHLRRFEAQMPFEGIPDQGAYVGRQLP